MKMCYICEDAPIDTYCDVCGKGCCDHHIDHDDVCVECSDELSNYESEVIDDPNIRHSVDDDELEDIEDDEFDDDELLDEFNKTRDKRKNFKCESCNKVARFYPDLDAYLCDMHEKLERS